MNLRNTLRKWLGIVDAAPAPESRQQSASWNIDNVTLQQSVEGGGVARVNFKLPTLPPGVYPTGAALAAYQAADGALARDDATTAPFYSWANQNLVGFGLSFQGYTYLAELAQRSEYRVPSETLASELTRKWIKFKTVAAAEEGDTEDEDGGGTVEKIEKIEAEFKRLKVREAFERCAVLDSFFGCGHMFIDIEGQDTPELRQNPLILDKATIKQGSLRALKPIEPYWCTPYSYNSIDPTKPDFYVPAAWFIVGMKTHSTRLMQFISRPVPDLLKPAYNFGGISLTQLMEPYVNMWLRTRKSVNDLIHAFSVFVLATDMQASLSGDANGTSQLLKRVQLFNNMRDNKGAFVINKDTEEFSNVSTSLASLDKLQAQSQEHMSSPSQIPLVKLFGITPSGLNASSDSEIQVFYDHVKARQQTLFGAQLNVVLQLVQLSLFGQIDESIEVEFVPLDEPSAEALSRIRKSDAEAGTAYIDGGVISPDEERERLQHDPQSGYNNLVGDAPEPPEPTVPVDPETGKPLEQPASQAFGGGPGKPKPGAEDSGWTLGNRRLTGASESV